LEHLFAALATGLTLYCVYLASDFTTSGLDLYGFGILAAVGCALVLLLRLIYALRQPTGSRLRALHARAAMVFGPLVILAVSIALIRLGVPSQLRFDWSRSELERVAKTTRERWSENESAGTHIGLYTIVGIDPQTDGRVFLDLGGCGLLDRCYFMYDPDENARPPFHAEAHLAAHWWLLQNPF
jgi:hypothetical protein